MSLLNVQGLAHAYGKKTLFDEDEFALGPTDRVGIIGANGTGKSTLMKIIAGEITPDAGTIGFRKHARVGYLPQDLTALPAGTLIDSVLRAVPGRDALDVRMAEAEARLAVATDPAEQMDLAQELSDASVEAADFDERYGRHRAERILGGLGFRTPDLERDTSEFSGGWRMRAALASLLLQDPDVLLLDEPTNHLDLPTLAWFDGFLRRSQKALILISHDRDFLDRQIDHVLSLEVEGLREYVGNYEAYKKQRAVEVEQLVARAAGIATKRAAMEAFVERFRAKATKARQAQSRVKMLEKLERVELLEERAKVRVRFPEVPRAGREVATFRGVRKSYGDNVIYEGLDAVVERDRRIAVVGLNGAGKTTLLKLLAGETPLDSGEITLGQNVSMGYYAQHHGETLDRARTVLEEISRLAPDKPQSHVRGVLGSFLFSGDDVDKPIGVLSGGERARVALAKLLLVPTNFLVMDEPTNHLDLDSSEALIEALKGYGGTLLFVSHNRSFLHQLATDVWDVRDRTVVRYPGNLEEYLQHLRQRANEEARGSQRPAAPDSTTRASRDKDKSPRRTKADTRQNRSALEGPLKKEISSIEARIAMLEANQPAHDALLADPDVYGDFVRAREIADAQRAEQAELAALYARWEEAHQRLLAMAGGGG